MSEVEKADRPLILIVDDEPNNVLILKTDLEDEGYDILSASDGVEGLEQLERHGAAIHLILLDRMMPRMNGMELMYRVKEHPIYRRIPVIMQTAAAAKEQVQEGIKAGVYYYLTKPYELEVLYSIVRAALLDFGNHSMLQKKLEQERENPRNSTHYQWQLQKLEQCHEVAATIAALFPDPERVVMGIAELLINAIEHGNLGISYDEKTELNHSGRWLLEIERRQSLPEYRTRNVQVHLDQLQDHLALTIKDEGNGFNWQKYLIMDPDRAMDNHGRGIAMANMLCFDQVEYMGNGNTVICRVRYTPAA
jgi:CheY-like chemotaxis protein